MVLACRFSNNCLHVFTCVPSWFGESVILIRRLGLTGTDSADAHYSRKKGSLALNCACVGARVRMGVRGVVAKKRRWFWKAL